MTEYQNNIIRIVDNVADHQLPDLVDLMVDEKWKVPSYAVNFIMNVNKKIALATNFDLFEAAISDSNYEEISFEEDNTLMPFPIVSALAGSPPGAACDRQYSTSTGNEQSTDKAPKILVEDMIMNEKFQCPKATVDHLQKMYAELFKPVDPKLPKLEIMESI
ncbi:unnamed protein product [Umbelopsis ramanniana]